jgi:hypothetical protein
MSSGNQPDQSQQARGVPSADPARPLAPGEVNEGQAVRRDTGQAQAAQQGTVRQAAGRTPRQQAPQGQQPPEQPQQAVVPDLNALRGDVEAELEARLGSGGVLPAATPGGPQPAQLSFEQLRSYVPTFLQIIQDLLSRQRDAAR